MDKLKKSLSEKNLSKLAKETGISRKTLSEYVNGKGNPNYKTLKKIACALNCEVENLI